jgi:hypothetical protein
MKVLRSFGRRDERQRSTAKRMIRQWRYEPIDRRHRVCEIGPHTDKHRHRGQPIHRVATAFEGLGGYHGTARF